jgi:hypothetical protein
MIAVKLLPVYLDDSSVSGALKSVTENTDVKNSSNKAIVEALQKQFEVNNVREVDLRNPDTFKISKAKNGGVDMDLNYQRIVPLFKDNGLLHTIDIVITFKHHEEIR